jgi:hypothetical protein
VALSGSSDVYHAIRDGDGSWQEFRRATVFDAYSPFGVSVADVGGELQIGVIDFTADTRQVIRHSIRHADGSWQQVGTPRTTGLTGERGILALAGTLR